MRIHQDNIKQIKVAIVQAIISPTREPWFTSLASYKDLDVNVFVLRETLEHRPGWKTKFNDNYNVSLVRSVIFKRKWVAGSKNNDIARRIVPIGLTAALCRYKPHYIAVTNATELLSATAVRLLLKSKVILMAEDTTLTYSRMNVIRRFIKKLLYRKADLIFAHSSECKKLLTSFGIGNDKITLTPWSVDNERFSNISKSRSINKIGQKYSLNGIVFVSVGALIPLKGHDKLLRTWRIVCETYNDNISLLLVGDGSERNSLEKFINKHHIENVIITGHLPPEEVALCLGASDVFIFPTLQDIWGLSVNEAMATGLPVIVSKNAGCHTDLVKVPFNGYTYDPYNEQELPSIIINLLKDTKTLSEMGNESLNIINMFSIDISTKTTHDAIALHNRSRYQAI